MVTGSENETENGNYLDWMWRLLEWIQKAKHVTSNGLMEKNELMTSCYNANVMSLISESGEMVNVWEIIVSQLQKEFSLVQI